MAVSQMADALQLCEKHRILGLQRGGLGLCGHQRLLHHGSLVVERHKLSRDAHGLLTAWKVSTDVRHVGVPIDSGNGHMCNIAFNGWRLFRISRVNRWSHDTGDT